MAGRSGDVRLGPETVPPALRPPTTDDTSILHLGVGAFHRAHQAVFTEDAGDGWGIRGVTQRSRDVLERLKPQDCLYSVLTRGRGPASVRVVGAVRDVVAGEESVRRIAEGETRIVGLTVTEKGYRHDPATGRLRTDDPEVAADLAGRPPRTVIGRLARGLAARDAPVTVLCCDNLPANGPTVAGLVDDFCGRAGLRVSCEVTYPATMVDRIVPAATDADTDEARRLLGVRDLGVVVAEPFAQWVIEDSFAAGRPAWERAGAILTDDVVPYETMKLRLLNGAHSTLAYLGAPAGFRYVSDAVEALAGVVRGLMDEDVTPTLTVPAGFDLAAYKASLLERFANPALRHRTAQIAMDGSQKLPQRLLYVAAERLRAGAEPRWAALAVAGWMRYVWAGTTDDGEPLPLDDPMADRLRTAVAAADSADAAADALLSVTEVFPPELAGSTAFRDLVVDRLARLTADGVRATVRALG